jgi:two-component system cell cycle sensor histidine kinase/response regulator CckA
MNVRLVPTFDNPPKNIVYIVTDYSSPRGPGSIPSKVPTLVEGATLGPRRMSVAGLPSEGVDSGGSHGRLALALDHADDVLVLVDRHGAIHEVGGAVRELCGRSPEALRGQPLTSFCTPSARPDLVGDLERAARRGRHLFTTWFEHDGRVFPVEISARVAEPDAGLLVCVLRDTTARDGREGRPDAAVGSGPLEIELRKLLRAVERCSVSVVITDPDGRVDYANPRFAEASGDTLAEMRGQRPRLTRPGDAKAEASRDLWAALRAAGEWTGDLVHLRRDGQAAHVLASFSPILDAEGRVTHFVGLLEDVTERRRSEQALAAVQQQLLHSQKMEAVGRLAGGVAHDFNNLLNVIVGYAELLARSLPLRDSRRGRIEQILQAAMRASALTRRLLAFSRKQVLQPRVVDMNAAVRETEQMLRRVIGEDVDLVLRLGEEVGNVRVDPGQLEHVILNLAVNARDAMPRGGVLTLATADADVDPDTAGPGAPGPGRYVVLSVADTGIGMDAETRARIFEPFFTTKPIGEGTGLGLATVYGIVQQSGGFVAVESEPGRGTTLRICLPHVDEPPDAAGRPTVSGPGPHGHETVLLVEDQDSLREMVSEALRLLGYRVLVAPDGESAIELAREHTGPLDLLVTDIVMPRLGGFDLARRLLTERPGLRVLYMSGHGTDVVTRHGVREAGLPLLEKPFRTDELALRVREALDRPRRGRVRG